jgi:antitoxin component YwqK of YwqJK toxin-antitoxin module
MLRRTLLPMLFSLLACALLAQPDGDLNRTDAKGRKQGAWAKSHGNGTLRYQGQFKDDKPQGEFRHFNEEGQLTSIQVYDADGRVSRVRHLHPDGSTLAQGRYVGQEKDSTWNYYDEQGRLRRVEQFVSGKLNGEVVTYYPSGQVADRDEFSNGLLHGQSRSWFTNGILKSEANYVNGLAEGRMFHYYSTGKKEYEGPVKKGERHGTWFHFNTDGSVHVRMVYHQGGLVEEVRENGTFQDLYPDEQPMSEVTYRKGKREGPFVEYYQNGRWVIKPVPADPETGARADVERQLQGQTKKREGTYRNDQLQGEVKEYDEKGKLVRVTTYEAGVRMGEQVKR